MSLLLTSLPAFAELQPAVAVLYGTPWSPGDAVRDGAAEMEVLLCAAQLRQTHQPAGIVGVGNRQGVFQPGTEAALGRVALMGLPVVRVARDGTPPANSDDMFIEAGPLSPAAAKNLLADCLARYGAPPAAADPLHPTPEEFSAIRAKVAVYQQAFDAAAHATVVAMR